MDDNILPRDQNHVPTAGFESSSTPGKVLPGQIDENTGRILVDNSGGGSGTVTSFSFTDGNGFDGTVTNPTTTPALSLATTVTGIIKGVTGALTAAVAGTDYTSLAFKTIAVSGQSNVVADAPEDTLTLAAGANITITTNAGTDTVTIAATGSTGVNSVTGTANRITIGGTAADPTVDIAATYVGQASITTLGTIATGVWNGTVVAGQYGGTGVANTGKTITVSGNTTIGSNTDTVAFVTTGNTSVTLPTSGTLATTTQIANMVTAAATFATDESILRADGTSRGAQATSTNATLTDGGAMVLASTATASALIPSGSSAPSNGVYLPAANTLGFAVNSTGEVQLTATAISPVTNDGNALGTSSLKWADLFLASGALIDWNATNVILTHSNGVLTLDPGDFRIVSANVGTNNDSVPTLTSTSTFTNKRVTPRVGSTTSSGTPTINTDTVDAYSITALAANITSFTSNLSGTPTNFQKFIIRIKDNGSARTISWGASFAAMGVTLPTTTVISKVLTVGFIWDSVANVWGCVASAQEA